MFQFMQNPKVLSIHEERSFNFATPDFEEIEAITPIDLLRRAGMIVHTASTSNQLEVLSKGGIQIKADSLLSDHEHSLYDALVIPGGPGIFKIRDHSLVQKKFVNSTTQKNVLPAFVPHHFYFSIKDSTKHSR